MNDKDETTNPTNPTNPTNQGNAGTGDELVLTKNAASGPTEASIRVPLPSAKEMEKMTMPQIQELLRAAGLPVEGKKAELIKRLQAQRLGGDRQVVHGNTLCPVCRFPAQIVGSRVVSVLRDGRRVKRYRLRCTGPRVHRFTIKQTEGSAQPPAGRIGVKHGH